MRFAPPTVVVLLLAACGTLGPVAPRTVAPAAAAAAVADPADAADAAVPADPVDPRCRWPAPPTELRRDGNAVLLRWELPDAPWLWSQTLPDDAGLLAFRRTMRARAVDPDASPTWLPEPRDAAEAEIFAAEQRNAEIARSGAAGRVRPLDCLEGLLFAWQHARYSQLEHPTEFIASILRRGQGPGARVVVVAGAGDGLFPPKSVYGMDEVERLRAAGWTFAAMLHDHTVQRRGDAWALGPTVPSTADVHFARALAEGMGLQSIRVTNGWRTIEVPASAFSAYRGR